MCVCESSVHVSEFIIATVHGVKDKVAVMSACVKSEVYDVHEQNLPLPYSHRKHSLWPTH